MIIKSPQDSIHSNIKDRSTASEDSNKSIPPTPIDTDSISTSSSRLKSSSLNPGPAVAVLANGAENEPKKEKKSMKAIVAAAALAAAFQAPMPLQKSRDNDDIDNDDKSNNKASADDEIKENSNNYKKVLKIVDQETVSHKEKVKNEKETRIEDEDFDIDKSSTPLYAVDPDAGIIDCICQINEDDGFTIQCDRCFRWQHASCFNIMTNDAVPDIYLCERCDPDSFKAKSINIEKMREQQLQLLGSGINENKTSKEVGSSQSSRKHSQNDESTKPEEQNKRRKRNSTRERNSSANDSKDNSVVSEQRPEKDTERKQSRKKKKEEFDDTTNEELITRIESAKGEYFRAVYYNSENLEYHSDDIEKYVTRYYPKMLEKNIKQKRNLNFLKISNYEYANLRKPQIVVRNILLNETTGAISSNYKFSGLSNMGLFLKKSSCNKGQLIEEVLGEVDFQVNYFRNSINQFKDWGLPKNYYFFVQTFSDDSIDGEDSSTSAASDEDSTNLAASLEKYLLNKKNKVADQDMLIPLYINCKTSGNITRFARKGCYPNCKIVPVMVGDQIKFFLQAIKDIPKDSELIIGWEFDFNPIFKRLLSTENINTDKYSDIMKYNFNNNFSHQEKVELISYVEFVLSHSKCGCYSAVGSSNLIKCRFLKIKKMGSYFFRSLRKGSKLNKNSVEAIKVTYGTYKINEDSILGRLRNRDIAIEKGLECTNDSVVPNNRNTDEKKSGTNASRSQSIETADEDLFKQNSKIVTEVSKRKSFPDFNEYKLVNSRVQLAKAIIANCLSVPVSSKLNDSANSSSILVQHAATLKNTASTNLLNDNSPKSTTPKILSDGKKVKKMSLTDFLRHKSN